MGELKTQPAWTEAERLAALRQYAILDTPREVEFDDIVKIAAQVCDAPIAAVNLIDEARQWFKAEVGLGVCETPLDTSICKHALQQPDLFVVPDTSKDERFKSNPLVTGNPGLRFYAGAVLRTTDGIPLGTMCVLDVKVRELTDAQADTLKALARQVMTLLELRRTLAAHAASEERQNLLIRELHHRVRNTLATVQGMLGATARSTSSADEFYRSFTDRVASLARTHAMITGANGQAASLRDILWSELEAFDDPSHTRVKLKGPDIRLNSAVAVPFGMAFHELTINAVKFGALSAAHGHVDVRWDIHADADSETLHIEWLEQGGPLVKEPTHKGLGSRLLTRVLTTQVNAAVKAEYHSDGLQFTVDAPMSSIVQPDLYAAARPSVEPSYQDRS